MSSRLVQFKKVEASKEGLEVTGDIYVNPKSVNLIYSVGNREGIGDVTYIVTSHGHSQVVGNVHDVHAKLVEVTSE